MGCRNLGPDFHAGRDGIGLCVDLVLDGIGGRNGRTVRKARHGVPPDGGLVRVVHGLGLGGGGDEQHEGED